jgi:pre-mRNA-processing factor 6
LEKARLLFPSNPHVWTESIRLEIVCDNIKGAGLMVSKALQECPQSGELWVLAIELEPKHQKKAKALDALGKCEHNAHIMMAIAKIFIEEKLVEKARKWFDKATRANPDLGDTWAHYYKFENTYGNEVQFN